MEQKTEYRGSVLDEHELSEKSRAYAERFVFEMDSILTPDDIDMSKISWETSVRAKRRHGLCSYKSDNESVIALSQHTYVNAGFEALKSTIQHELIHAWQHQNNGLLVVVTEDGCEYGFSDARGLNDTHADIDFVVPMDEREDYVRATTGHGDCFHLWEPYMDYDGRCSSHYEKEREQYSYIVECPECEKWWGYHRLCKTVRLTAKRSRSHHCSNCNVYVHLSNGSHFMKKRAIHSDEDIKSFYEGNDSLAIEKEDVYVKTVS